MARIRKTYRILLFATDLGGFAATRIQGALPPCVWRANSRKRINRPTQECLSARRSRDSTDGATRQDKVTVRGWSQVAIDILVQKYLRKAGVPKALRRVPEERATSCSAQPDEAVVLVHCQRVWKPMRARVFDRFGTWTYWASEVTSIARGCPCFTMKCGSCWFTKWRRPIRRKWFNTALYWAYGMSGPSRVIGIPGFYVGAVVESHFGLCHPQPACVFYLIGCG